MKWTAPSPSARRAAISPVPSGESSSTIRTWADAGSLARACATSRSRLAASSEVGRASQTGPRSRFLGGICCGDPSRDRQRRLKAPPPVSLQRVTNAEIAAALEELGVLYELDGAVKYRVLA